MSPGTLAISDTVLTSLIPFTLSPEQHANWRFFAYNMLG
jgi:hypothetical protein